MYMFNDKKIAVVVPAFNEENLILKTINSIPKYVDSIIVVNDASTDSTREIVENFISKDNKTLLINHEKNSGVGSALITGYKESLDQINDITVIMPGDAQALPEDFENLIKPIINNEADYCKGNRLNHKDVKKIMPKHRFIGNTILSLLTKFASGYYNLMDPQMGYTAISNKCLEKLSIDNLIKRYGYPGQLLHMLNMSNAVVFDVDVKPHYGEEVSGLRVWKIIPKLSFLLLSLFFKRVFIKLILKDLTPAGIAYFLSFIVFFIIQPILLYRLISLYTINTVLPELTFISLLFAYILFIILFFFGLLFDIQENSKLNNKIVQS